MGLTLTTAPTQEPIEVSDLAEHLRIDATEEQSLLGTYITAARKHLENITWRQFVTATYTMKFDRFPCGDTAYHFGKTTRHPWRTGSLAIWVPKPPLQSVTSITYADANGTVTTWTSSLYGVDATTEPGLIIPAYNQSYPTTRGHINDITVVFVAGYGTADDVPEELKQAIKLLAGHFYEHREAVAPMATHPVAMSVDALAADYMVRDERILEFV